MKSASSKIAKKVQAGIAACLLPVFFMYVLLDKPDYKIMNAMSGIVVPAARVVGDGITWPVRVAGKISENMRMRHDIRRENRELRKRLDDIMIQQAACVSLAAENQRLEQALDIVRSTQKKSIIARVIYENSAFSSNVFVLDKGTESGIKIGDIVLSKDGFLAGTVIEASSNFARIRGLRDTGASTPVRVSGSDVMGFLRGRGNAAPAFEMFSDQEFSPTAGTLLLSSGIGGNLPEGIPIGRIKTTGNGKSAPVSPGAKTMSEAVILIK